jgi:uncharacterized protein (DUF58 family)
VRGSLRTIGFGTALILAGASFDLPSLYVPGLALPILAGLGAAWVALAARTASITRAPGPSRLMEGETFPVRIETRARLIPLPGGEVEDPLLPAPDRFGIARRSAAGADVPVWGRGRRRLEGPTLVLRDPLGLASRRLPSADVADLLVLPLVEPVSAAGGGGADGTDLLAAAELGGAGGGRDAASVDFEIDGLRPYREGSPASLIHWPTVARSGEVFERRLVAGTQSATLVALDAGSPIDEALLDRAVRAAASLCLLLARRGGCAVLLPGMRRPQVLDPSLGRWPHVHARLALVRPGDALRPMLPVESLFWVSAKPATEALRDLERSGAARRCLVTPDPILELPSSFTVAGCHGHPVGAGRARPGRRRTEAA